MFHFTSSLADYHVAPRCSLIILFWGVPSGSTSSECIYHQWSASGRTFEAKVGREDVQAPAWKHHFKSEIETWCFLPEDLAICTARCCDTARIFVLRTPGSWSPAEDFISWFMMLFFIVAYCLHGHVLPKSERCLYLHVLVVVYENCKGNSALLITLSYHLAILASAEVIMMRCRQKAWGHDADAQFIFLSSDSSLQSGCDYQMTLEDRISRRHTHMVARRCFNSISQDWFLWFHRLFYRPPPTDRSFLLRFLMFHQWPSGYWFSWHACGCDSIQLRQFSGICCVANSTDWTW